MDRDEKIEKIFTFVHLQRQPFRHLICILNWFNLMGEDDKEFGFKGSRGFEDQLKDALDFLKGTELKWQKDVLSDSTDMPFFTFLEQKAIEEGIDIPEQFAEKLIETGEF